MIFEDLFFIIVLALMILYLIMILIFKILFSKILYSAAFIVYIRMKIAFLSVIRYFIETYYCLKLLILPHKVYNRYAEN